MSIKLTFRALALRLIYYCCVVWHHCGQLSLKKLDKIDERSLLLVFFI